jgi:hypothetical protein
MPNKVKKISSDIMVPTVAATPSLLSHRGDFLIPSPVDSSE